MIANSDQIRKRNVAVYARVSTEHEAQLSALDNQVQYYDNILKMHPEWTLYKYYIDEGITGTSTKKRKSFLEMLKDAEEHKFDLIITREVSRFARNTVDTLQETRKLKAKKIEVWFTEDNIWTMNDEDGELRLTIMATLAQNESKKTSIRVKAGQRISFENAVPYGNGNILGYNRTKDGYVIDPVQSKTVKRIFELYLQGNGMNRISYILEQEGYLTSTGLTHWDSSAVSRTLRNPFYCGTVVYRKQYVPDYLEQKKINNFGDVEKVVVEGKHEPIVSKEDFEKVQNLLKKKKAHSDNIGIRLAYMSDNIWNKKLVCPCGGTFHRKTWHKVKGVKTYAYQCYRQIRTGTVAIREKKGLSTEDICTTPMVPEWKLNAMLMMIIENFFHDRKRIIKLCDDLLEDTYVPPEDSDRRNELKKNQEKIQNYDRQLNNLLDLCVKEIITQEQYKEKKKELNEKILHCKNEIIRLSETKESTDEQREHALELLRYGIEQDLKFDAFEVPEEIIDALVNHVVVYPDYFEWHLNIFNMVTDIQVSGDRRKSTISYKEARTDSDSSTGSNR